MIENWNYTVEAEITPFRNFLGAPMVIPDNPLGRRSGEGRNPAIKNTPRSGQNHDVVPLAWGILIIWIPAYAGMTQFFLMDYLGSWFIVMAATATSRNILSGDHRLVLV